VEPGLRPACGRWGWRSSAGRSCGRGSRRGGSTSPATGMVERVTDLETGRTRTVYVLRRGGGGEAVGRGRWRTTGGSARWRCCRRRRRYRSKTQKTDSGGGGITWRGRGHTRRRSWDVVPADAGVVGGALGRGRGWEKWPARLVTAGAGGEERLQRVDGVHRGRRTGRCGRRSRRTRRRMRLWASCGRIAMKRRTKRQAWNGGKGG
jgi:hypothetical protein